MAFKAPRATFPQRCQSRAQRLGCSSIPISQGSCPRFGGLLGGWGLGFFFLWEGLARLEGRVH